MRAQKSTMGKKIWLSMHPRNFVTNKIVRRDVGPRLHVNGCEMSYILAVSPKKIQIVFNLILDIHVIIN